ncbi:MAG: 30S ribosomal protein S12 methylthiotransferase RimO [Calditerrivibrio sp.]|nr:30S ribosomal protein S12 methylthiotransferase RimO [Calditerrivibrio sp.]
MNVAFISLGCSKNQTDLEYLIGDMVVEGFNIVTEVEKADAIIVNTCGFLQSAVSEAIENILDVAKRKKKRAKLIVSGCMVERYMSEIAKELPEIDFYTGVGKLSDIISFLKRGVKGSKGERRFYGEHRVLINPNYYAYVKISEGCNNRCSYCTIPSIRGNLVSRSMEDILKETGQLISKGVKEIILISQDTTKYGMDGKGYGILDLLENLVKIEGDFKIRLLYMNPDGVNEALIDFVANHEKMIKYFEIPVQHIDDDILKKMNRRSDSSKIKSVFKYIRDKVPKAFIRTTFIVGFPGEDERAFDKLRNFILEYKPDYAGFFPYSREEGTVAYTFGDIPAKSVVKRRITELQKIQKRITSERLKKMKKDIITIFIEGISEENPFLYDARAEFQAPEIDGKTFVLGGEVNKGYGPYKAKIRRVIYPDIYCELI